MNNAALWDVTPCGSCKGRRFEGTYSLHHRVTRMSELRNLAVTSNRCMLPGTPMMEAIRSSETSVFTRATRRIVPEDILHRHSHENITSYEIILGEILRQWCFNYVCACLNI
jgi:hypothetical protein